MSFSRSFFSTIIFLVVLSTTHLKTTLTNAVSQPNNRRSATTVHIITDSLPENNSNPDQQLRIRLSNTKQSFQSLETTLKWGESFKFVAEQRALYYGEAIWGRFMGSWHAFQPKRDSGHDSVFWFVKPNGFFLSWDNSTWVRKALWETE